MKRGCDLLIFMFKDKIKRSQPRFTRQLLQFLQFLQLPQFPQFLQKTDGLLRYLAHPTLCQTRPSRVSSSSADLGPSSPAA
ncbi:hypothetical protein ABH909_003327 [Pseudomonas sp. BS3782 TE3695]